MAYTTEAEVRRQGGFLIRREVVAGSKRDSNGDLLLDGDAFALREVFKNGDLQIDPDDFSFEQPRKVDLVVPATDDDTFVIKSDVGVESNEITEFIERSETIINSILVRRFGGAVPFTTAPALVGEIAMDLTIAWAAKLIMFENHSGLNEKAIKAAMILEDKAKNMLKAIDDYKLDIIGVADSGDTLPSVGRAGQKIFAELDEIEGVDYFDHYQQLNKRDRGEVSPNDW